MDFVKQYLVQSISYAAGNLRLTSNQMEALALFKELILKSEHLEDDLLRMKKVTEFSTLAIKLYDFYNSLTRNTIDISTISDKFRQQSQTLAKDVNLLLYHAANSNFKNLIEKVKGEEQKINGENKSVELSSQEKIFKEKENESSFSKFEESILNPIKPVDSFLSELLEKEEITGKIDEYIETMDRNYELSKKNGFEVLSGMHSIVFDSLTMLKKGDINPDKETVESLRACLIVIAAVVRGKEVNISEYLTKAGNFRKKIDSIKNKGKK